jgi:hypothetical protein
MHTVFLSYRRVHVRGAKDCPPIFSDQEAVEMYNKPAEARVKARNEVREFALVLVLVAVLLVTVL